MMIAAILRKVNTKKSLGSSLHGSRLWNCSLKIMTKRLLLDVTQMLEVVVGYKM